MSKKIILILYCIIVASLPTASGKPLKFGIASIISPEKNIILYQKLNDYLGQKMGNRVDPIYQRDYEKMNFLIEQQDVDFASICSGAYVQLNIKQVKILALPAFKGSPTYKSYIIVNKNSNITAIEDLRGKTFVFTDKLSNSGPIYPQYYLKMIGTKADRFFSNYYYTNNHDKSIFLINQAVVDGAAVDSLVFDYIKSKNDSQIKNIKIIHKSPEFTSPPLVASRSLSTKQFKKLQNILVSMNNNPFGEKILQELKIDRFVRPHKTAFDRLRKMVETLNANSR